MPRILLAFALVTWLAACSSPPPALTGAMTAPSLLVTGDVERELRLDAAAFERLFAGEIGPVEHRTKQGTVTLRGLPLLPVIEAARPRYGDEQKHPEQCFAVLLRARDGYAVAFANEELRPDRDGRHRIRLAFAEEDGPLPDRFAPARLVIDDQGGNSRRIAGLTEIVVIDLRRAAADLEERRP